MSSPADEPQDIRSKKEGADEDVQDVGSQSPPTAGTGTPPPAWLFREGVVPEVFPLAETGEYYEGLWSGIPNYRCPFCTYAVATKKGPEDGDGKIELHILTRIEQGEPRHTRALEPKVRKES